MNDTSINSEVIFRREGVNEISDLDRLRIENPVVKLAFSSSRGHPGPPPGFSATGTSWLVTRYDDVRSVLGDHGSFSSKPQLSRIAREIRSKSSFNLIMSDPPDHTHLRQILEPEFSMARLDHLAPRIEEIAAECLDSMERNGQPVDLVRQFTQPTALFTLAALLGINRDEAVEFQRMRNAVIDSHKGDKRQLIRATGVSRAVARQRAEPGDNLIGRVIRQHGDEFTDDQLQGISDFFMLAGYDNTAAMLTMVALLLLDQPSHFAAFRDESASADDMIDEMLRYSSVVPNAQPRTATTDTRIGDQVIRKGDSVVCSLVSADRDDVLGEEMNRFHPDRAPVSHVAFGYGIHRCIGARLARLEAKIALHALVQRFPELKLDAPLTDLVFRFIPAYCAESLPAKW